MTAPTPTCMRCRHPHDWHRLDDARNLDPTDPATPFRCLGYDPEAEGQLSIVGCDCPDLLRWAPDDVPFSMPPTAELLSGESEEPIATLTIPCAGDCGSDDPHDAHLNAFWDGSNWIPRRDATQAEINIARAWVARHRWTNPRDAEVEYEHALAVLVFGNARPPLRNGRFSRAGGS